jgi:phosphoserine aminotransferase
MHDIFEGVTINTPSMLCVEDYLDALAWIEKIGGIKAAIARANANAAVIYDWIARTAWAEPLAVEPATRSNTSVCIRFVDAEVLAGGHDAVAGFLKDMTDLLAARSVAYDIAAYRGVTPGLRIWTGTTIEREDLIDLVPWLDFAYREVKQRHRS